MYAATHLWLGERKIAIGDDTFGDKRDNTALNTIWREPAVIAITEPEELPRLVSVNVQGFINELQSAYEISCPDCDDDALPIEIANPKDTSLPLVLGNSIVTIEYLKSLR